MKRNTDNQMTTQLSHHQKKVLEYLAIESKGFRKKMFVFNNEAVRANYMEGKLEAIDAFIGLPSGFMDCHTLYQHGFEDKTQLIYFDVNQNILNFKKKAFRVVGW